MRGVLVVVAHPDDEVLACGGSIAKWRAAGVEVGIHFMADGETSRRGEAPSAERLRDRLAACVRAAEILGHQVLGFSNYPDNQMDTIPLLDVVRAVETVVERFGPDTVVTHSICDLNIDHQIVAKAVHTAIRPLPKSPVKVVLAGEVASSTEWGLPSSSFCPNLFVDVSEFIGRKLKALSAYRSEVRPAPHPRSLVAVEALARWRGSSSGCDAAEGFELVREIA
jgi:LmbE family N-acetylglucosaminyl deacetylase